MTDIYIVDALIVFIGGGVAGIVLSFAIETLKAKRR
jgi:hypothetical protein